MTPVGNGLGNLIVRGLLTASLPTDLRPPSGIQPSPKSGTTCRCSLAFAVGVLTPRCSSSRAGSQEFPRKNRLLRKLFGGSAISILSSRYRCFSTIYCTKTVTAYCAFDVFDKGYRKCQRPAVLSFDRPSQTNTLIIQPK